MTTTRGELTQKVIHTARQKKSMGKSMCSDFERTGDCQQPEKKGFGKAREPRGDAEQDIQQNIKN